MGGPVASPRTSPQLQVSHLITTACPTVVMQLYVSLTWVREGGGSRSLGVPVCEFIFHFFSFDFVLSIFLSIYFCVLDLCYCFFSKLVMFGYFSKK